MLMPTILKMPPISSTRNTVTVIVLCTVIFVAYSDAMISMRYAWNLSHGYGLVWNVAERVEGITNLLMTLYMSVWTFALDKHLAVLAVQISGVAFLLAAGYGTMRTGEAVLEKSGLKGGPVLSVLFFSSAIL